MKKPHHLVWMILPILTPLVILSNLYLYLYPAFVGCSFPVPPTGNHGSYSHTRDSTVQAPFRLLALADPQLEGDSALPRAARLLRTPDLLRRPASARMLLQQGWQLTRSLAGLVSYHARYLRKQVDLLGNDFYLAHIYRTLHYFTGPTHTTVLGDLLGSQWISQEEFMRRSWRFWNRVFRGASRVPHERLSADVETQPQPQSLNDISMHQWSRDIIGVAGNHDIGYAGDIDEDGISRFEHQFGPVNGQVRFTLPAYTDEALQRNIQPSLRLVVLNTMNLDSPQLSTALADQTRAFVNQIITTAKHVDDHSEAVVLLTHIPLHKQAGLCSDSPMFNYYSPEHGGGIREQNFLSPESSKDAILQGIFGKCASKDASNRGLGRDGIILTGHDHVGCDVYHWLHRPSQTWHAAKMPHLHAAASTIASHTNTSIFSADEQHLESPGIREVTVRSMMGEFHGNAALLSAWWDSQAMKWQFEVKNCQLGVQHIWWAIHVLDLLFVVALLATSVSYIKYGITIYTFNHFLLTRQTPVKTPPINTAKLPSPCKVSDDNQIPPSTPLIEKP